MKEIPGKTKYVNVVTDPMRDQFYNIAYLNFGDSNQIRAHIKDQINVDHHPLIIHQVEDLIVGFIKGQIYEFSIYNPSAMPPIKTAHIDWFYLHPDFQWMGIGTMLFQRFSEYAKLKQAQEITLYSESSESGKSFYDKNGFKSVGYNELMRKELRMGK